MRDKNQLLLQDGLELWGEWLAAIGPADVPLVLHHPRMYDFVAVLSAACCQAFSRGWEHEQTTAACSRLARVGIGLLSLSCFKNGERHPDPVTADGSDPDVEWRMEELAVCLAAEVREMRNSIPDPRLLCPPAWVPCDDPWQFAPEAPK